MERNQRRIINRRLQGLSRNLVAVEPGIARIMNTRYVCWLLVAGAVGGLIVAAAQTIEKVPVAHAAHLGFVQLGHTTTADAITGILNDMTGLDPHTQLGIPAVYVMQNIFQSLVTLNENLEIVPEAAESWEVQEAGRTYVFPLRRGVQFHDGTPFDAAAVKWNFERLFNPEEAIPLRSYFTPVEEELTEQFHCNYGLNPVYRDHLSKGALRVAGVGPYGEVRIVELSDHRFFLATLFVPQLSSSADTPHPLVVAYLNAARAFRVFQRRSESQP
jgi:hypothetical protein